MQQWKRTQVKTENELCTLNQKALGMRATAAEGEVKNCKDIRWYRHSLA